MDSKTRQLKRQGKNLLPVIAYGDAAGLPFETRSAKYIRKRNQPDGVTRLEKPVENPYYKGDYPVGSWSDDTELSIAVADAIISAEGVFDIEAFVETHIKAYDETDDIVVDGKDKKLGWGGSTTDAVERLIEGVSPAESGTIDGAGNGVLMKMAPLVFWQTARAIADNERYDQYDQLTVMTHASDVARLTTRVHGDILKYLMTQPYDRQKFVQFINDQTVFHEEQTNQSGTLLPLLKYLGSHVDARSILKHTDGKGFFVPQTVAMAYGAFIAHGGEFTPSVYEAVNLGGDTDSTASIVATMSHFANKGREVLPDDFSKIQKLERLQEVSRELTKIALR